MVETEWLNDDQQRAWRSWLDANAQLTVALHRGLQASSGLSLADYDILVALTDVPERSLRMYEIGDRLQWEKSRVSKQVARMAARGLVRRRECVDDRRGAFVDLTDEGQAAIEAAAPDHVDLVRSAVFAGLSAEQVATLAEVTDAILQRLAEIEGGDAEGGRRAAS
ncbi:MarR family transcriptional regulator [Nocardioides sp. YIM 152588]|uniref:MarR family winged helix-turn-helix transcriptional regulator n=1 Tax=Nocardioides sp. YIM 152588 TaxID=3158259 RepID=UPI0032E4F5E7